MQTKNLIEIVNLTCEVYSKSYKGSHMRSYINCVNFRIITISQTHERYIWTDFVDQLILQKDSSKQFVYELDIITYCINMPN